MGLRVRVVRARDAVPPAVSESVDSLGNPVKSRTSRPVGATVDFTVCFCKTSAACHCVTLGPAWLWLAGPFEKRGGDIFHPRSSRDNKSIQGKRWRVYKLAFGIVICFGKEGYIAIMCRWARPL